MSEERMFTETEAIIAGANPKFLELVVLTRGLAETMSRAQEAPNANSLREIADFGKQFHSAVAALTVGELKEFMEHLRSATGPEGYTKGIQSGQQALRFAKALEVLNELIVKQE